MTQLIVFRAVQGLGAGAMLPIAQAIIGALFPPAERGKWQGLLMAVFGVAAIIGPLAGGWITDHWGWRWAFYVNMPVGVLALLTAGFALPGQVRHQQHPIDYRGAALLVAAAVPMLLAFSWAGTEYPWVSVHIVGLLAFAALMWAVFMVAEVRAAEPIISPSLFREPRLRRLGRCQLPGRRRYVRREHVPAAVRAGHRRAAASHSGARPRPARRSRPHPYRNRG
jgi:MFS family permease